MRKKLLKHILSAEDIESSINDNLKLLIVVIPELRSMINFDNPDRSSDLWAKTIQEIKDAPNDFEIRTSILLHHIGAPHYLLKADIKKDYSLDSAKKSETILKNLGFDAEFIKNISTIIGSYNKTLTSDMIRENPMLARKIFEIQKCNILNLENEDITSKLQYLKDTQQIFEEFEKESK